MTRGVLMMACTLAVAALATQCYSFVNTNVAFAPRQTLGPKTAAFMSDDFLQGTPDATKERIGEMVENHPVLLFMKGSKLFPQCGFSNTAVQILQSYDIDFHTVDVLSDEAIRQGVKEFSQWPTIPQLYVVSWMV